jgi:hypothetical protein
VSRTKTFALGFLGIVIPMALAFTAYLISRNTIGAAGTVPSLTHAPAQSVSPSETPSTEEPKTGRTGGEQGSGSGSGSGQTSDPQPTATSTDDHSGKCSEPGHINDSSCDSGSSGSGSGSSGSGSNSGHGGGGDD